jgi:putative membrane protein
MSIPVFVAQRLGMFNQPPPIAISEEVARRTPLLPAADTPGFSVVWVLAHFAYGAAGGTAYCLVRRQLPASWFVSGLIFGGAVWTGSYAGYLPALDLYPAPPDDRHTRQATMIVAHAIYGLAVAAGVESSDR